MWNVALHIFPGMIVFLHEFCFRLQVREVRQSCGAVQDAEGSRATAVATALKHEYSARLLDTLLPESALKWSSRCAVSACGLACVRLVQGFYMVAERCLFRCGPQTCKRACRPRCL